MIFWHRFSPHRGRRERPKVSRPVITGIGVVSPIGIGHSLFWDSLLSGKTGIDRITLFDASKYPTQIAAEVRDLDESAYLTERQQKHFSRMARLALVAFRLAQADCGLAHFDRFRTDVVLGSASIAFEVLERQIGRSDTGLLDFKEGEMETLAMLRTIMSAPANAIALDAGLEGYVTTVTNACASALTAVAQGAERIRHNQAEVVICGGVDTPITPIVLNAHCSAGLLTTQNGDPRLALAPFDARRTKPALGEGAAVFIVEDRARAVARGARIYAEIEGFAQANENINELFMMDRSGQAWSEVMKRAGVEGVDHINAHGPSDRTIDRTETTAIRFAFGKREAHMPVTSIKGAVGSGMASAGAFQIAASALTLHTGTIPPIYNYGEPDPNCDLDCVAHPRSTRTGRVMISSHALGGVNSILVLGAAS